ncbi:GmrSD restriction endonuclease domain-containing protein [Oceanospirillum linum]|uniref:DUF262 domain-containing protein n=1 Tax=Oceanospirillum linum TaxID=966 RepID=A0A1T1HAX6_OCELI|nr:DUF262 domain-containing protein [Oceanospirillum linum]OOV86936.1 hypothetical protein BTA35_0211650 [Oceanospirillum linum]SEG18356.1 Protein of unknown function [Oleiphilus messinensis]SMP23838.1 Protein of unknown function [Oceanospirillum linum]
MNAPIETVAELSVAQLFGSDQYQIPLYQRNYAWTTVEVEQLLSDILDMAVHHQDQPYYIGSLIVHQQDSQNTLFETIDGQQRHTTLSIILAALKKDFNRPLHAIEKTNLCFEARESSSKTLSDLFSVKSAARPSVGADTDQTDSKAGKEEIAETAMLAAYNAAIRFLKKELIFEETSGSEPSESDVKKQNIADFTAYLLEKVKILRVIVPKETDLNHYFEIMNNRGEQLEKHEVLKARMLSALGADNGTETELEHQRTAFAAIWDACAEMHRYLQLGIKARIRHKVFGDDWNSLPDSFEALTSCFKPEAKKESETADPVSSDDRPATLAKILQGARRHDQKDPLDGKDNPERFHSIINFPNFLLQVLRLYAANKGCKEVVLLDDKQLLKAFDQVQPEPKRFLILLLKCRFLFDRYLIKRDGDKGWVLKKLTVYRNQKKVNSDYTNSYSDSMQNKRLEMLQAMFHVTYTAQNYKNWLQATLQYLDQQQAVSELNGQDYERFLEGLSDRFLRNYLLVEGSGSALDLSRLHQGTAVANFIFNRLDYKLWLRLSSGKFDELVTKGSNIEYIQDHWGKFHFTQRSSVEHFYPQNPRDGKQLEVSKLLPNGVDSFGNLCLISHSSNSRYSDFLPTAKKEHFESNKSLESLKQLLMMSYKDWGPDYPENIKHHEELMVKVLLDGLGLSAG